VNLGREATPPPPLVRRARPTLPPKAALVGIRVDGDGQVVSGAHGYYWYGDGIVLSTAGENGAEYLLGGASVPVAAVVALQGVRDARRFQKERPDVPQPEEEWAWHAWAMACFEQDLFEHAVIKLGARSWVIYHEALAAAMGRL
jgi:hypothetical protein